MAGYMATSVLGPYAELDRGMYGLLGDIKVIMINKAAKSVILGSVLTVDISGQDASTTYNMDRTITDVFRRAVTPNTKTASAGISGIVIDLLGGEGADGTEVVMQFRGKCPALVYGTSGAAAGTELKCNNAETVLDRNGGSASKTIAYALGATSGSATDTASAELIDILLIGPWGSGI